MTDTPPTNSNNVNMTGNGSNLSVNVPGVVDLTSYTGPVRVEFSLQGNDNGCTFPSSGTYGLAIVTKDAGEPVVTEEFSDYQRSSDGKTISVLDANGTTTDTTTHWDYTYTVSVETPDGTKISDPIIRNRR